MSEIKLNVCTRKNTCFDCDSPICMGAGKKASDCPKWRCDMPEGTDCETECRFINEFIEKMREVYGNES